jgi:hypothetical protein
VLITNALPRTDAENAISLAQGASRNSGRAPHFHRAHFLFSAALDLEYARDCAFGTSKGVALSSLHSPFAGLVTTANTESTMRCVRWRIDRMPTLTARPVARPWLARDRTGLIKTEGREARNGKGVVAPYDTGQARWSRR